MNTHQWMDTLDPIDFEKPTKLFNNICLTIAYHPHTERIGERVILFDSGNLEQAALSRLMPIFKRVDGQSTGPLASLCLSRRPLWIVPVPPNGIMLQNDSHGSEIIVDGKPVPSHCELTETELKAGVVIELARRIVLLMHSIGKLYSTGESFGFIGHSEAIERIRNAIRKVADKDTPVLIRGETGSGKELVANAIHTSSLRAKNPFVCVNMAAVSTSIAPSELFGHVKGAFTGALGSHVGYLQQAHTGTLFLDEIGSTPIQVQAMLLRALETKEIQPVGSRTRHPIDVRIIAATDENLESAITTGSFRAPLFHRLSNFIINVPPLRERRDDIARLFIAFLRNELNEIGEIDRLKTSDAGDRPWIPTSMISELLRYRWPGNVRELYNVVRQIVISSRGTESTIINPITPTNQSILATRIIEKSIKPTINSFRRNPSEIDESELIEALRRNDWHIQATAAQLNISRASLYTLIERSQHIRKAKDISLEELTQCIDTFGHDLISIARHLEVSVRGLKLRMRELDLL